MRAILSHLINSRTAFACHRDPLTTISSMHSILQYPSTSDDEPSTSDHPTQNTNQFHYPTYPRPGHWHTNTKTMKRALSVLLTRGWDLWNKKTMKVKLTETNMTRMLNDLFDESSDVGLAFYFFRWSRRCNGVRHGLRVVCTMIHIAVAGDLNNLAMDFLRGIVKNDPGVGDWHGFVFDVLRETSRDWGVLETVYSMLVSCYVRWSMMDTAMEMVVRMKKFGFFPSRGVCYSLLAALLESKKAESAVELFMDMRNGGAVGPELVSLFIREHCSCGSFGFACKLLLDIQHDYGIVDIVAYTIVIDALCKRGLVKEASALLCKIIRMGVAPDSVLLGSLVDAYCKAGRWEAMLGVLSSSGFAHDVFMYNSIIWMLCNRGDVLEANQLLNGMFEAGLPPDSYNFSTVIDGYCKASQMSQALKIFAVMLKRGAERTVLTYTMLIKGYCRIGDLRGANDMFVAVEREGLKPDVVTYNVIMEGYTMQGKMLNIHEMKDIMTKNGVSPDAVTYNIFIHGLVMQRHLTESREIFKEFVREGLSPDKITYTNIIHSFSKERNVSIDKAKAVWCSMNDNGMELDIVACSTLLNCFCRMRNTEKAVDMFKEMIVAGLEPDVKIYNTLVWGFCRERKYKEACEILTIMAENGVAPTRVSHLALVHALYVRGETNVLENAATDLREIYSRSGIVVGESQLVDPDSWDD